MRSDVNSRILFHTPQPLDTLDSGSSVRPAKMIEAFKQLEFDVDVVNGDTEERRERVKDIQNNNREYKFCYSEPTTWPLHPLVDYRFYWYLLSNNIPTGIFYRDIYWQFPELFDRSGLKYWELQLRYRLDLAVISRVANQIYVPSASFGEQLDLGSSVTALPPGGIDRTETNASTSQLERVIYVGGLSELYGPELLSRAFEKIADNCKITLDLVCRETEFQSLSVDIRKRFDSDWVNIYHISGDELHEVYTRADAGIIPKSPTAYNDMAVSVKLFEYLSYGLPIITTNVEEMASFVQSFDCGLVCEANHEDLAQGLVTISTDEELYRHKKENAVQALKQNRWVDRAKQVTSDLMVER